MHLFISKGDEKNVLSFLDFIDSIKNEKEDVENQSTKSDKDTADIDIDEEEDDDEDDAPEPNKTIEEIEMSEIKPTVRKASQKKKGEQSRSTKGKKLNERRQDIEKFEPIEKKQKVSDLNWKEGKIQNVKIRSIFKLVYDFLSKSLFNPKWEIRHGACIALRNFIKKDIHKLYMNLNLSRSEIVAVDDQEESLTTFIRETVRGLSFSNAFFEDFLSRQLVIIALDRFMDHSSDRVKTSSSISNYW